jgi:hypothetical protein
LPLSSEQFASQRSAGKARVRFPVSEYILFVDVVCLRDVVEGWGKRGMKGCFCASVGQQKEEQTGGQLSFCMYEGSILYHVRLRHGLRKDCAGLVKNKVTIDDR